ncbi:response regulator [Corticibacter populi]|uniref:histidine kinase n=1 Tax=Corticibacter populi TaxID=1550736 RepID=A0A3M6QMR3_9BURK|nr:hybrid sensor histidine kinase/response regulator [Corticibacter populi]RMX04344.1 response regulator [Corticibacter populi]RZS33285.1 signal transduction histidine kinase [Corticibacter populi]
MIAGKPLPGVRHEPLFGHARPPASRAPQAGSAADARPQGNGAIVRRWFRLRLSLVQQLVLLVLAFSSLSILAVLGIMANRYLQDVSEQALRNTQIVAQQMARAAATPLQQMDRRALMVLTRTALAQPGMQLAQVHSPDGEILAQAMAHDAVHAGGDEIMHPVLHEASGMPIGQVVVRSDGAALRQVSRSLWWTCGSLFVGGLLAVGVSGWWVARRVSAPLCELAAAVDQLAQGEAAQVENRGTAEIGRLQRGFNRAALALAHQRSELERQVRQATAQIKLRNVQLQAADQAKSRMLAAASHDLRQPLHALTLFTDALQSSESDPARIERVARVRECVDALDRLFTGLLDLAQLDAGTMQPVVRTFALDALFDELSRNFRAMAEERDLRLVVRKTDVRVRCDYVMLLRMLNNLVSNALRYTVCGGVLVVARRRGERVRIDVIDSGIGIAEQHQQQVFEEFYQVDALASRAERGLGLGLATVRRLSQLLDIPVRLRSRPGHGTMVSLEVGGAASPLTAGPAAEAGDDAATPPAAVQRCADGLAGLTVLVIDDEVAILEGLELVLGQDGATVVTAQNRAQALARFCERRPDVVVCDLLLGAGDSGLEVLQVLRQLPPWQADPPGVLLVTGETSADRLREIASAAVMVLHKPVPPWLLRCRIAEAACARSPCRPAG